MKEIDETGCSIDVDGEKYYKFDCNYVMNDGKEFSFYIWATSWKDADERITAIKQTVRNGGQIIETIPYD